jgi:hypothetical protein
VLGEDPCLGYLGTFCCKRPAFGQTVVAVGQLLAQSPNEATVAGSSWVLAGPELCEESRPAR